MAAAVSYVTKSLARSEVIAALERASGRSAANLSFKSSDTIKESRTSIDPDEFGLSGITLESYMCVSRKLGSGLLNDFSGTFAKFVRRSRGGTTGILLSWKRSRQSVEKTKAFFAVCDGRCEVSLELPFDPVGWKENVHRYRTFFALFSGDIAFPQTAEGCLPCAPPEVELRLGMHGAGSPVRPVLKYPVRTRIRVPEISPEDFWGKILKVPSLLGLGKVSGFDINTGDGWDSRRTREEEVLVNYQAAFALLESIDQWKEFTYYVSAHSLAGISRLTDWLPREKISAIAEFFPWLAKEVTCPVGLGCTRAGWFLVVKDVSAQVLVKIEALSGLAFTKKG